MVSRNRIITSGAIAVALVGLGLAQHALNDLAVPAVAIAYEFDLLGGIAAHVNQTGLFGLVEHLPSPFPFHLLRAQSFDGIFGHCAEIHAHIHRHAVNILTAQPGGMPATGRH